MTGPLRRGGAAVQETGLNYAAIGATRAPSVVAFPPDGFRAAEYRHRIGSGARRFDTAARSLMTWGALRSAGFRVDEVRAEASPSVTTGPLYLDDGTPWITSGMTAVLTEEGEAPIPVKVVSTVSEAGRIGYVYGTRSGSDRCGERLLLLDHGADDAVQLTLRTIWQSPGSRWSPGGRRIDARQRRIDERIVRALHPAFGR